MRTLILVAVFLSVSVSGTAQEKSPVPGEAEQKKTRKIVGEVFRKDYEVARNNEQKTALSKKMLDEAMATKNDPVGRYVLLDIVSTMAADAGDLETSMQAVTILCDSYQVLHFLRKRP